MALRRAGTRTIALHVYAGESTGRLLLRVARELRTRIDREAGRIGLTMQQAELLVWCHRRGEVSPRALTGLIGTDEAGISRLIGRLHAKGLVARRPSGTDGRSRIVALTAAGRALIPRVARRSAAAQRRVFIGLSGAELAQLDRALRRVATNLRGRE